MLRHGIHQEQCNPDLPFNFNQIQPKWIFNVLLRLIFPLKMKVCIQNKRTMFRRDFWTSSGETYTFLRRKGARFSKL